MLYAVVLVGLLGAEYDPLGPDYTVTYWRERGMGPSRSDSRPARMEAAGGNPNSSDAEGWEPAGEVHAHTEPCATCPSGRRYSGYLAQWFRKGNRWAYAIADSERKAIGWWFYDTDPPKWVPAKAAEKRWLESLDPVDRRAVEQYHYRLSPASCGMLGCPIHSYPMACPSCAR